MCDGFEFLNSLKNEKVLLTFFETILFLKFIAELLAFAIYFLSSLIEY